MVVETTNLTKQYGKKLALSQVSLKIEENKLIGIAGRNGSGKTTLLSLISGFLKPTSGQVRVLGENPIYSLNAAQNRIFIDDKFRFGANLNLKQCLEQAAQFYPNFQVNLAENMLEYFNLDTKAYPAKLSKGMKSTFFAIVGLCARAPLTIMDEPTTGMDSITRHDFYKFLLKDYILFPRTVLISSHLLGEFEDILEEIIILNEGRLLIHMEMDDFHQYAVKIRGRSSVLRQTKLWNNRLFGEETGDSAVMVCLAEEAAPFQNSLAQQGCRFEGVAADDLYSYMTAKTKGGIEDVYRK